MGGNQVPIIHFGQPKKSPIAVKIAGKLSHYFPLTTFRPWKEEDLFSHGPLAFSFKGMYSTSMIWWLKITAIYMTLVTFLVGAWRRCATQSTLPETKRQSAWKWGPLEKKIPITKHHFRGKLLVFGITQWFPKILAILQLNQFTNKNHLSLLASNI